jgi:hypothetical protein
MEPSAEGGQRVVGRGDVELEQAAADQLFVVIPNAESSRGFHAFDPFRSVSRYTAAAAATKNLSREKKGAGGLS